MVKKINNPAKKKAWDAFSRMIRVRDAIATTGFPFVCICITCNNRRHLAYMDAGHLFAGRGNAKLFQEELVNGQCRRCNQYLNGRLKKYRKLMDEKYGVEQVEKWEAEGLKAIPDKEMDFEGRRERYIAETNEMLKPFGYNNYKDMMRGRD